MNFAKQYKKLIADIDCGDLDAYEAIDALRLLARQCAMAEPNLQAACYVVIEDIIAGAAFYGMEIV